MSVERIAELCGARLEGSVGGEVCGAVSTDSRSLTGGELFIALRGERYDGHDYVGRAAGAGACAAMVADDWRGDGADAGIPLLRVDDTLLGLQRMAAAYRATLPMSVLAITGSNGKTSVKDMAVVVLSSRYRVHGTVGNFNNHIGLPLSMLSADAAHEYGVFEIGMNHPGEIAPLARLADPALAIVTNVGSAHIEFLKTRDAIAEEKASLPRGLGPDGVAILPAGDEFIGTLRRGVCARIVTTGVETGDLRAVGVEATAGGSRFGVEWRGERVDCALPVPGRHMVLNALMAIAAGVESGIPLAQCCEALAATRLAAGRLCRREIHGVVFIDDSYNANLESMRAALEVLAACGGRKVAVLGAMGELGEFARAGHLEVGGGCAAAGLDLVVAVGAGAAAIAEGASRGGASCVESVDDVESAVRVLEDFLRDGDTVLVKGSRSARMERVMEQFQHMRGGGG